MEIDMAGLEMKYAAEQRFERAQEELQTMWDEAEDEVWLGPGRTQRDAGACGCPRVP